MAAPAALEGIKDVASIGLGELSNMLKNHQASSTTDSSQSTNDQEEYFNVLSKVNQFKTQFLDAAGVSDPGMADKIFNLLFSPQGGTLTLADIENSGLFEAMGQAVTYAAEGEDANLAATDILTIVYNQLQRTMDAKTVTALLQKLNHFAQTYYIFNVYHNFATNDRANLSKEALFIALQSWGHPEKGQDGVQLSQLSYFATSAQSQAYLAQLQNEKSKRNLLVSQQFLQMTAVEAKRDIDTAVNQQLNVLYANMSKVYGTEIAQRLIKDTYWFIRVIGTANAYHEAGARAVISSPVKTSSITKGLFRKAVDFKSLVIAGGSILAAWEAIKWLGSAIMGGLMHNQTPPDASTVAPTVNSDGTQTGPTGKITAPKPSDSVPTQAAYNAPQIQKVMQEFDVLQRRATMLQSNFAKYNNYVKIATNQFNNILQTFSAENACASIQPYTASMQNLGKFITLYKQDLAAYNGVLEQALGLSVFMQNLVKDPTFSQVMGVEAQMSDLQQAINGMQQEAFEYKQQLNSLEVLSTTAPQINELLNEASKLCNVQNQLAAAKKMYGLGYPGLALNADRSYNSLSQVIISALNKLKNVASSAEATADPNMQELITTQIQTLSKISSAIQAQQTNNLMEAWNVLAPNANPGVI